MFLNNLKRPRLISRIIYRFSTNSFDYNKDYFKVLGIQKTATQTQIKSAFYKLAKQYHPDLNKGNESKFKQINEAYSVLSDNKLRKQYENARNMGSQNTQSNNFYSNTTYGRGSQGYQYQDPFQRYRTNQRPYYGNPNQEYQNWHSQYNQRNNQTFHSQRGYQTYEEFAKTFQQFHQSQRQRQAYRRRQQQQAKQYERQRQFIQKNLFFDFKTSLRRSFMLGIFLSIMLVVLLGSKPKQPNYPYPPQMIDQYTIVDLRGSPYMQKRQYVQNPHGNYNYSDSLVNKKVYYQ